MNLSDLAAKGAKPIGFLLSVALPPGSTRHGSPPSPPASVRMPSATAVRCSAATPTARPDRLAVSIAAFGAVPHGKMVRRSTAKPGDSIVVTGTIGDAALGVLLRRDPALPSVGGFGAMQRALDERYLLPEPRNVLAEAVLHDASAAMDVSDGLAGDLAKLCRASAVAAEIDVARVPLSDAARAAVAADPALIETVLTGGDDYEIVLTLAPEKLGAFCRGA